MAWRAWTGTERVLLRDHYATKGPQWCVAQINHRWPSENPRTLASVRMFALKHGYTGDKRGVESTPLIDAMIRKAYEGGERGAPARIAQTFGRQASWVSRRAGEMGLTLVARDCRPYSLQERAFVEQHAHLSRGRISQLMKRRGWRRTAASIQHFLRYHRLGDNGQFYSPASLALCLGVAEGTVRSAIGAGLIVGSARSAETYEPGAGAQAVISEAEIARYVVQNAGSINPHKVDLVWLIDLVARLGSHGLVDARDKGKRITAIKAANPALTPSQIAAMTDSTPRSVSVVLSRANAERRAA